MIIRFSPEADTELAEAREWYGRQRENLDVEFMQCIDAALLRIKDNPSQFPVVYQTLRRVVVRRFPFAIFYDVTPDEIQVLAVFHSRRDPQRWKSRTDSGT
ncbi:MAG TPA: type II toxin-antitoxin system RelE/ParE family toxin [Pyrinomonadaceae bacterium]|nr:type II toxin-antitoxin system RelE/ParE family toxin [Pyrinomonadaceae bacterium]